MLAEPADAGRRELDPAGPAPGYTLRPIVPRPSPVPRRNTVDACRIEVR